MSAPSLPGGSEIEALEALGKLLPAPPPGQIWFGDDAASLPPPSSGTQVLVALDTLVAGLDADLSLTSLADLGWKALAVNLSDIAAMGGVPSCAVVGVVGLGAGALRELYEGLLLASARYGCPVVGGDLSAGDEVVVTVSVNGWVQGSPVLRDGARSGDAIWVTRPLGAAAAGLRCLRELAATGRVATSSERVLIAAHARPEPALAEGAVAKELGATAMIDVSDGLALDLSRLALSSGVGFELSHAPIAPGATLQDALGGGDDYALIFTLPADVDAAAAFEVKGLSAPLRLGECTSDRTRRRLYGNELPVQGWVHAL